jgi:hypothetical protein
MLPLRSLLLLLFLLVRVALVCAAGNEPINILPDPASSTFRTRGMQFWKEELPSFMNEYLPLQNGRVISGGLHPTSGSCTSSAFALEAITNSSQRITANGAGGTAVINYAAGNIGANCAVGQSDVCWVVGSSAAVYQLQPLGHVEPLCRLSECHAACPARQQCFPHEDDDYQWRH